MKLYQNVTFKMSRAAKKISTMERSGLEHETPASDRCVRNRIDMLGGQK